MTTIKPFDYEKHDENDFYSAYCALKHNRRENIRKANINILIRSLAVFYILCVIFDDRCTPLQNSIYGNKVPYTFTYNSDIFSANVYDKQLDDAQRAITQFAEYNKINNIIDYKPVEEMLQQCEKNLNIRFREQKPEECLFATELTPEYLKKIDCFKEKYSKNNRALRTEHYLLFGDYASEKTFEEANIDNFDMLMDHIKSNLEKSIANIIVNHSWA